MTRFTGGKTIYDKMVIGSIAMQKGMVWCRECRKTMKVDSAECLRTGWPKCCGATMTIDEMPKGRKTIIKKKEPRKKHSGGMPKNRIFRVHVEIPAGATEDQMMDFIYGAVLEKIEANKKWNPNDLRASINTDKLKVDRLTPKYCGSRR